MGKYILLEPKEAPSEFATVAAQFQSKTSVFPLSDWEVQDPLEQEWVSVLFWLGMNLPIRQGKN
jgi:hypothetical protein